jgi:hypothetical protein
MSASWHYLKDGRPFGPFALDQMRQLASSGLLAPTDMVKSDANGVWVPAGSVAALDFSPAPVSPPAVVPPPLPTAPASAEPTTPAEGPQPSDTRSVFAMAAVWLALVPLALGLANRSQAEAGNRLPTALLIAGAGLALATWLYLGVRAVRTGVLPTFSGRLRKRPLVHRVGGLALLFVGASLAVELVNAARHRPTGSADVPASAAGYERVRSGTSEEVLYRPRQRSDAERLAAVLRDLGEFNGQSPKTFAVEKRDGGWVVKVVTTDAARRNPAVHAFYRHSLGVRIAARAFPGEPVEFQFCDPDLNPHASVPLPAAGVAEIQGKDAVYFLGPHRAEADRLAAFLKPRLVPPGERAFVLARADATWTFAILNADADALTPAVEKLFAKEATDVSRAVFGGATAEVVVYDRAFQPKRTFRSSAGSLPLMSPPGDPFEDYQKWRYENRDKLPINWDDYRPSYQAPPKKDPP